MKRIAGSLVFPSSFPPLIPGLAVLVLLGAGCATTSTPSSTSSAASRTTNGVGDAKAVDVANLEERSVLMLLVDRMAYEPLVVSRSLQGPPALRRDLALVLGRAGDRQGESTIASLLADPAVSVRRAAAFAWGEFAEGDESRAARALSPLKNAAVEDDPEVGRLAVEALAKLDTDLTAVDRAVSVLGNEQRWSRLLPSLFRFSSEERVSLARLALTQVEDPGLRRWAAYALARDPLPAGLDDLRGLAAEPDPRVRAWVARGLGRVGEAEDLGRLETLLGDVDPGVVIQAFDAAKRLFDAGTAAPPEAWRSQLLARLDDDHLGVRLAALAASSAWLRDEEIGAKLLARVSAEGVPEGEREVALMALAEGDDPEAGSAVSRWFVSPQESRRALAAQAAIGLEEQSGLLSLLEDSSSRVRTAAFAAAFAGGLGTPELVRLALGDADAGVRIAAWGGLAQEAMVEASVFEPFVDAAKTGSVVEEALGAIGALQARAEATVLERGRMIELLEGFAEAGEYAVRRAAANSLEALDRPRPAIGGPEPKRTAAVYRDIVRQTSEPRTVRLETEVGNIDLRLDCPMAPLTCLNFLQLAGQGYFDGLTFHRVVPDFVLQGGDPRGDGYGGPGWSIRDEINPLRYQRGTVGMALAGPHTGGSQFFIALAPQPHLDGGYTVFGYVVAGDDVLDRVARGTQIVRIVEVTKP